MLTITRRLGGVVRITTPSGETIDVLFCEVKGKRIRLGFECDRSINIDRLEKIAPEEQEKIKNVTMELRGKKKCES